jgi:hypothetical protein
MERVETLLKKLQDQFAQKAAPADLLLTVQLLQAELMHLQGSDSNGFGDIAVTISQSMPVVKEEITEVPKTEPVEEERTVEVLQVDEAELEAELEEIKRNAEALQKISAHNKPHIVFEPEEDIPTLAHQYQPKKEQPKKEVNEMATAANASVNDKLKQSKIDLGDTLTEVPVRDLKKAIGVNDRFLYINELFRGDEVSYERSIKTINSFSILPEAEYWIQRELKVKNGWNDSNDVVKQFYQLVKRRFS